MIRILAVLLILGPSFLFAQKYKVDSSEVSFFSEAPLENISAINKKSTSLYNRESGEIAFSIPIKSFVFEKALMQEHFNEKYLESDKYPRATFSGILLDLKQNVTGEQEVKAKGKLTIHGVTRELEIKGIAVDQGTRLQLKSKFKIKLEDYKITIPQLVIKNIAEEVEVSVNFIYTPQ